MDDFEMECDGVVIQLPYVELHKLIQPMAADPPLMVKPLNPKSISRLSIIKPITHGKLFLCEIANLQ
jgi:hypothetical protein